ncbi:hypothetical protein O6H91_19G042600 [Diphasiastrum complanatum]|uniref:Uncharacterized protein n=1 Tax=Diphasiastrum complanatum TaxID=34168 RepID=A0ACC2AUJ9_DIPCM|nr:hypothetical protein O6H91_19G042600 [Diphasiastrum complanatum]
MKFGKRLQSQIEETLPEWRDKFLSYKHLKKRLKLLLSAPDCFTQAAFDAPSPTCGSTEEDCTYLIDAAVQELRKERGGGHAQFQTTGLRSEEDSCNLGGGPSDKNRVHGEQSKQREGDLGPDSHGDRSNSIVADEEEENLSGSVRKAYENDQLTEEEADFIHLLNVELEKFNTFFMEKEEEYVIRLQELKERIEKLQGESRPSGRYPSVANGELIQIRKDIVTFHGEMVLLLNYSSLNYTGLVKILKKHDKRTGALLRMPFIQSVLHQPFFTTELLTKLVHECESNLHSIFPAFANDEVTVNRLNEEPRDMAQAQDASVLQGEDVDSIYRSTMAALRTIQDLRKGSSTHSSLSGSSLNRNGKGESDVIVNNVVAASPGLQQA